MIVPTAPRIAGPRPAAARLAGHGAMRAGRGVIHIDLAAAFPDRIEPGPFPRSLVIFWWKDVPVGHVFLESQRCSPERLAALAESAVEDDLITKAEDRAAASARSGPVSVIVCTRDRPQELAGCLESLLALSRPPEEIVVVDDGSEGPATRRIVAGQPRAVYRRQQACGLGAARNTGIRAARHEILVFTDDDVRHHPLWLERLVAPLDDGEALATTGLVLPFEIETEAQYLFERAWSFGHGYRAQGFGPDFLAKAAWRAAPVWEIGSGASMAFRRRALQEIGGFDERLDIGAAGGSGDAELWYRLLAKGWRCRYEPSSVAYHRHCRDIEGLETQIRNHMSGHVAALLIQAERHGHRGNLRRIAFDLPEMFLKLAWSRLLQGPRSQTVLLGPAVQGYFSGLTFYAKHRRRW